MKKVVQPNVRKVYGVNTQPVQQTQDNQMNNAVRKIHNLLSSGAVTVTGPNQPRILKQKMGMGGTIVTTPHNSPQLQQQSHNSNSGRCYVCDDQITSASKQLLTEGVTTHTNTKFPNKIGQVVGDAFMVIVSVEDVVCSRCSNLLNYLDRLETDTERVKNSILNLLGKKYGLNDDAVVTSVTTTNAPLSPPSKMQKMNSGNVVSRRINLGSDDSSETIGTRKIAVSSRDPVENQLSSLFDGGEKQGPATSAVHQIKISTPQMAAKANKGQIKIYKCMHCDFKTPDLKLFTPHYEVCKNHQHQNYQCKYCKKLFSSVSVLRQHITDKHPTTEYACSICQINFVNEAAMRKHQEINHSEMVKQPQMQLLTTVNDTQAVQLFTCNTCQYKTTDKPTFDEHMRKHKMKPFKCRLCSMRFESREQASIHAKTNHTNYFKCGTCSAQFPSRDNLVEHFKTHQVKPQPQAIAQPQQQQAMTTQKLLQDTIDEALRESSESTESKSIHFFTCNICSLTFIQESYYNQHMETHKREPKKPSNNVSASNSINSSTLATSQSLIRQEPPKDSSTVNTPSQQTADMEADIESIFEKMHSDKSDTEGLGAATASPAAKAEGEGKDLVITSQENSVGGITFNVTIPQVQENANEQGKQKSADEEKSISAPVSVSIDMPVLDPQDEAPSQQQAEEQSSSAAGKSESETKDAENEDSTNAAGPVSMPSLDDDSEATAQQEQEPQQQQEHEDHEEQQQHAEQEQQQEESDQQHVHLNSEDQVPMDLDELQNSVNDGQIKFILNENGQLLQLDNNHIITDADGNQILVQGSDSEQIQQLLQSVGVLQGGDGIDGETLQMIGDNNQMVIVQQGDGNEAQLIDASLLNADGQIVIHQSQDGDLSEGAHVIGEDGVRIPVSVSYTADGQPILQAAADHHEGSIHKDIDGNTIVTSADQAGETHTLTQAGGEGYFALEDLMQQPKTTE